MRLCKALLADQFETDIDNVHKKLEESDDSFRLSYAPPAQQKGEN